MRLVRLSGGRARCDFRIYGVPDFADGLRMRPTRPARICLTPGCPDRVQGATRCPRHQRQARQRERRNHSGIPVVGYFGFLLSTATPEAKPIASPTATHMPMFPLAAPIAAPIAIPIAAHRPMRPAFMVLPSLDGMNQILRRELHAVLSNGSVSNPTLLGKAGYGTTVIAIVPAVRFPVPVDVTDGVAVTVAVPGAMPRTSPASETVKTLVLDESKMTELICDGCSGFDVPSENVRVTASWITSPTRTVAGPVTSAVTSRLYMSVPHAMRLINASATTSVPVRLDWGSGVREPVRMLHLPTNGQPRGSADFKTDPPPGLRMSAHGSASVNRTTPAARQGEVWRDRK